MTEIQRVAPHYPANEPILLGDELRLSVADAASSGSGNGESFIGQAWLRLAPPRPSLEVISKVKSPIPWNGALTLAWGAGNEGKFFQTHQRTTEDGGLLETRWSPSSQPILVRSGRGEPVSEIHFGVINFPDFIGRGDELRGGTDGSSSRHGRVQVAAGPWRIELRESGNLRDILRELDSSRGFAITHEGRIVRSDRGQIDTDEACLLLRALDDFLSFARGAFCSIGLVRSLAADEEVVWERWGCRRVDPWQRPFDPSWFDLHHGHTLGEAFPGFWTVYSAGREQRGAIHEALYWYLRSGTQAGGVDGGLILMQAALERLAHTFYGPKKNKGTQAWLRDALGQRQIPQAIPGGSRALKAYVNSVGKKGDVTDGVFAITRLRNNAVHPRKDASVSGSSYLQAWGLARWFVELMVLNVTGYKGRYANRLTRRFEPVPWAGP